MVFRMSIWSGRRGDLTTQTSGSHHPDLLARFAGLHKTGLLDLHSTYYLAQQRSRSAHRPTTQCGTTLKWSAAFSQIDPGLGAIGS
jgi:hypothetical protein